MLILKLFILSSFIAGIFTEEINKQCLTKKVLYMERSREWIVFKEKPNINYIVFCEKTQNIQLNQFDICPIKLGWKEVHRDPITYDLRTPNIKHRPITCIVKVICEIPS